MTGAGLGRPHTERTAPLVVPSVFWALGTSGIVAGLWRVFAVRRLLAVGDLGVGSVLASVHLFTLGGFTLLMMGALYQLVPVLLNCAPVRPVLSLMQCAASVIGTGLFVVGFTLDRTWLLSLGGAVVLGGIAFFLVNMIGRIRARSTWNVVSWFFTTSLFYLGLTMIMGGLLAVRYVFEVLQFGHEVTIHVAIAAGGWFGMLMVGVSYRLWAMFGRGHREPRWWAGVWVLGNAAIWCWVVGHLVSWPELVEAGWAMQVAAFVLYQGDVLIGLAHRGTLRDPALRNAAAANVFLWAWEALGSAAVVSGHARLWAPALFAYGLGWLGLNFLGWVQKLIPFMVWLHRHSRARGNARRLNDIWDPRWAWVSGVFGTSGALLLTLGALGSSADLVAAGTAAGSLAWLSLWLPAVRALLV